MKTKVRLKKQSKQPISKLQRLLWAELRRVADKVYPNDCYTCPAKNLQGSNKQLGHVPWPKSTLSAGTKYDLRFTRWQCMRCNIHGGGMGAVAYARMLQEDPEELAQMEKDRHQLGRAYDIYTELLAKYRDM